MGAKRPNSLFIYIYVGNLEEGGKIKSKDQRFKMRMEDCGAGREI